MRFPLAQCSDLETRQIKWISRADQLKNGSRPSAYIHWGLPAAAIAATASDYQGWQGPGHRYHCNPEAPRLSFFV